MQPCFSVLFSDIKRKVPILLICASGDWIAIKLQDIMAQAFHIIFHKNILMINEKNSYNNSYFIEDLDYNKHQLSAQRNILLIEQTLCRLRVIDPSSMLECLYLSRTMIKILIRNRLLPSNFQSKLIQNVRKSDICHTRIATMPIRLRISAVWSA